MIRFLFAVGLFLPSTVAFAQTPPPPDVAPAPTTRAANDRSLTPEQLNDLHVQVVELMREGKYDQATEIFDRVYNAVPAAKRTRPLVLNRAILDLVGKRFIMRGVRDLSEYLAKHRGEDELATNVLGACLNVAAGNSTVKSGAQWQTAFKEWDRRNYLLDHSRTGWRRWGARWVTADETKARETRAEDLRKAIDDQSTYINRLLNDAYSLAVQQQNALDTQAAYQGQRERVASVRDYMQRIQQYQAQYQNYNQNYKQQAAAYTKRTGKPVPTTAPRPALADPNQTHIDPTTVMNLQGREWQLFGNEFDAAMSAQNIGADLNKTYRDISAAQAQLRRSQAQLRSIRPQWPDHFDPVDPAATTPSPTAMPSSSAAVAESTFPAGTSPPTTAPSAATLAGPFSQPIAQPDIPAKASVQGTAANPPPPKVAPPSFSPPGSPQ